MISVGDFWYTDCGKMVMEGENYGNEKAFDRFDPTYP